MKNCEKSLKRSLYAFSLSTLLMVPIVGMPQRTIAQDFTLANLNSSVGLNITNSGFGSAGMTSWFVDGVNQLYFQTFYYRVGSGQEYALDNISSTPLVNFTGSGIEVTYANASLSLKLNYNLFGNQIGSQNSGIGYSVQVLNTQAGPLDFHLFQYSDFDLGGVTGGQNVSLQKVLGTYKRAVQTYGSAWMTNQFNMTGSPLPTTLVEANLYNSTLLSLTDLGQTTFSSASTNAGPGDATYAIQWDASINPGNSISLSGSFTTAVPEPSSFSLVVLGVLTGVSALRRAKQTSIG